MNFDIASTWILKHFSFLLFFFCSFFFIFLFKASSLYNEIIYQKSILNNSTNELNILKNEIKYIKEYSKNKLNDILIETIVTQEELIHLNNIIKEKNLIINTQNNEINSLKDTLALMLSSAKTPTHNNDINNLNINNYFDHDNHQYH